MFGEGGRGLSAIGDRYDPVVGLPEEEDDDRSDDSEDADVDPPQQHPPQREGGRGEQPRRCKGARKRGDTEREGP